MSDQSSFCQTGTIPRASGVELFPCFYSSSPTPIPGESYGAVPVNGVSDLNNYNYQFSTTTDPVPMDDNVASVRVPPNWTVFTYRDTNFAADSWASQTIGTYFANNVSSIPSGVDTTTSTGLSNTSAVTQQAYDWKTFVGNCANKTGNTTSNMCGPYWGNSSFTSNPTGAAPTSLPSPLPSNLPPTPPSTSPPTDGTTVWVSILIWVIVIILFILLIGWIVGAHKKPKETPPSYNTNDNNSSNNNNLNNNNGTRTGGYNNGSTDNDMGSRTLVQGRDPVGYY